MPLYAIKDPKGKLLDDSVSFTKGSAWSEMLVFSSVKDFDGDLTYDENIRKFKNLGYRCVRVYLTEEKP